MMSTDSRLSILRFGLILLLVGGLIYGGLKGLGISDAAAQTTASLLLFLGLVSWSLGYLKRVLTGQMTYHQQRKTYETEQLRQMIEQMTPEELAALQAEIEEQDTDPESQSTPSSQNSTV